MKKRNGAQRLKGEEAARRDTQRGLIKRERCESSKEKKKRMGRARAGCNDGEVTRDADERWRERQREQREMSRIFHVESAGEQADRETKRAG